MSTIDDRRNVLRSLLEMVQLEYSAFKPFVTLLAPTLVKVAETDLDGVCRFYARRVLFRAFERATDGDDKIENEESAIVDAVTSLVPIFVDQTTQTSLRCLTLLLEKVTRKESVEKNTRFSRQLRLRKSRRLFLSTITEREERSVRMRRHRAE